VDVEVAMQVLWWLVPPLVTTGLAMIWAAWLGRARDDIRRDDSDAARLRMQKALARPTPQAGSNYRGGSTASTRLPEVTHGVVVRKSSSRPVPSSDVSR